MTETNILQDMCYDSLKQWIDAQTPDIFSKRYVHNGIPFAVSIQPLDEKNWTATAYLVNREADDPNTDIVDYDNPLFNMNIMQPIDINSLPAK